MFGVNQISGILMVSFVLFSFFAGALCDWYDFPIIQNVFKKVDKLENDIIME